MPDEAEPVYPPANADAPPPAEGAGVQPAASNDADWLKTSRPVDAIIEDRLPEYIIWCRKIMREVAQQQNAPEPPEDFLKAIIPRAVRHVRHIARSEGTGEAVDVLCTDPTSPLHWVMHKVRKEWERGLEAAEKSEDDDMRDDMLLAEKGWPGPWNGM